MPAVAAQFVARAAIVCMHRDVRVARATYVNVYVRACTQTAEPRARAWLRPFYAGKDI